MHGHSNIKLAKYYVWATIFFPPHVSMLLGCLHSSMGGLNITV